MEDCLRKFCSALDTTTSNMMFGAALALIESKKDLIDMPEKDIERQIKLLQYIKDEFRNPSAHPDKHFTQREAEQLFQFVNVSIDKMSAMFESISNGKTSPSEASE